MENMNIFFVFFFVFLGDSNYKLGRGLVGEKDEASAPVGRCASKTSM